MAPQDEVINENFGDVVLVILVMMILLLGKQRQNFDKHGIQFKEIMLLHLKSQRCLVQDLFWDQTLTKDHLIFSSYVGETITHEIFLSFQKKQSLRIQNETGS